MAELKSTLYKLLEMMLCIVIICIMHFSSITSYLNHRTRDMFIICGMVYLSITSILLITALMGEDTAVMQTVLFGVGAVLNFAAAALIMYDLFSSPKGTSIAYYFMLGPVLLNGNFMFNDARLSFKKIFSNEE